MVVDWSQSVVRSLVRRFLWRRPAFYRPVGILRKRGDCMDRDFDVWFGGYPRSANTFAMKAFELGNPGVKTRGRLHVPPFVIQALHLGKPGMFLVRKPEDAVLSWAIFAGPNSKTSVLDCINYYIDFHRILHPRVPDLFIAHFDDVTTRFDEVMNRFNDRFHTNYLPVAHDSKTVGECFDQIEKMHLDSDGYLNERRVCRPSAVRAEIKTEILDQLHNSPGVAQQLKTANDIYEVFSASSRAVRPKRVYPEIQGVQSVPGRA
jgi:hypothetical protein